MASNEMTLGGVDPDISGGPSSENFGPRTRPFNGSNRRGNSRGRYVHHGAPPPPPQMRKPLARGRDFNRSFYVPMSHPEQSDFRPAMDRNFKNDDRDFFQGRDSQYYGRVGTVPKQQQQQRNQFVNDGPGPSWSGHRTFKRSFGNEKNYSANGNYRGYTRNWNDRGRKTNYNVSARTFEPRNGSENRRSANSSTNSEVLATDNRSVLVTNDNENVLPVGDEAEHVQNDDVEGSKISGKSDSVSGNRKQTNFSINAMRNRGLVKKFQRNQHDIKKQLVKTSSQRDCLIDQLAKNAYECMVCCDRVRVQDTIWNCPNCFHIFHLKCVKKWAKSPSSIVEGLGWRCPACQHITEKIPYYYYCFCAKTRDPGWNHYDTPHSCGEVCGKQRSNKNCVHRCNILCHPGPCPSCHVQIQRACECGKTTKPVPCGHTTAILCNNTCEKLLNCKIHVCQNPCHENECSPCMETIEQNCSCGKMVKRIPCTENNSEMLHFSCEAVCNSLLDCGNHRCKVVCHESSCEGCLLSPDRVATCPCGQTSLSEISSSKRATCLDPIPTCDKICNKLLPCGSAESVHKCPIPCHEGPCPECELKTSVKCRCGFQSQEVECKNLSTVGEIICNKRCNKKRQCSRHKCLKNCCTDDLHPCEMICKRKLSCGLHSCEESCHRGNCPVCWHTSFDELSCHCGKTVMFPPIPCGTRPPECNEVCSRVHECDHPITHSCHSDSKCPPCTFLTEKWCYGNHELRSHVPCYLTEVSCGLPCGKPLSCGVHKCLLTCHSGDCAAPGNVCKQLCTVPRAVCGHPCSVTCHPGKPCPNTPCRAKVLIKCQCGNLSEEITCAENLQALHQEAASAVASKLSELQAGQTVTMGDVFKSAKATHKRLECNADCELIDRNRRLALALQIRNPELTNKLGPPAYTDFLKEQMKQNSQLVSSTYNKLTELVQMAKQSKQKSRSHAFPPMNREHRRVIHELAEFFGCETCSYDEEPKKNVVATALRDKSWLPSVSIMTVMDRELLPRKPPPPIPHHKAQMGILSSTMENIQSDANKSAAESGSVQQKKKIIDYFDYTPE